MIPVPSPETETIGSSRDEKHSEPTRPTSEKQTSDGSDHPEAHAKPQEEETVDLQGKTVSQWIDQLSSASEEKRSEAIEVICRLGPQAIQAAPQLIGLLGFSEHDDHASWALSRMGDAVLPALFSALKGEDEDILEEVLTILGRYEEKASPACRDLVRLLGESDLTEEAGNVLVRIGAKSVPHLLEGLLNEDGDPYRTREILERLDPPSAVLVPDACRVVPLAGPEAKAMLAKLMARKAPDSKEARSIFRDLLRQEWEYPDDDLAEVFLELRGTGLDILFSALDDPASRSNAVVVLAIILTTDGPIENEPDSLQALPEGEPGDRAQVETRAAQFLVKGLADPDAAFRKICLEAFTDLLQEDSGRRVLTVRPALQSLLALARDTDPEIRSRIFAVFVLLDDKCSVRPAGLERVLIEGVSDLDGNVRLAAIQCWEKTGFHFGPVRKPLLVLLERNDPWSKYRTSQVLFRYAAHDREALKCLIDCVRNGSISVSMGWSGCIQPPVPPASAAPLFAGILKDKDESVRLNAIRGLGAIGTKAADWIPSLLPFLKDPSPTVRMTVGKALGYIARGREDLVPVLAGKFEDGDPRVRQAVASTLARIAPSSRRVADEIARAAMDERLSTPWAISLFDTLESDVPPPFSMIREGLKMDHPRARNSARRLMIRHGHRIPGALPFLLDELGRSDWRNPPAWIICALKKMGPDAKVAAPIVFRFLGMHGCGSTAEDFLFSLGLDTVLDVAGSAGEWRYREEDRTIAVLRRFLMPVKDLFRRLSSHDSPRIRKLGIEFLEKAPIEKEDAFPSLEPLTRDPDPQVRRFAVHRIRQMKYPIGKVAHIYLRALFDAHPDVRYAGAWSFVEQPPETPDVMARLAHLAADEQKSVCTCVLCTLGKLGARFPGGIPILTKALEDPRPEVRERAARSLGRIGAGARSALPALRTRLSDKKEEVQMYAASAIWRIGERDEKALDLLIGYLRASREITRSQATCCIRDIGAPARAAVPALIERLEDSEYSVRSGAAEALAAMGPAARAAVPVLIKTLKDPHYWPREYAAEALGRIGIATPKVIRGLKALSQDEEEDVREAATQALRALERR